MRNSLIILSLLSSLVSFSQKEANNWYFGQNAGITFNGGQVKADIDGQLNTYEGCASVSDKDGNLLFYTDGSRVWDRTHTRTPNGTALNGNTSSSQSAVIVPFPDDDNKFYVFTVENEGGGKGLQYSVFDMSLNNGKGDIASTKKNIKLIGATCEKIAVVRHPNGKDYWIITHIFNSDVICAFALTSAGVNKNPVKSNTGLVIDGNTLNAVGYMKSSPDGTRIAYANYTADSCCLVDFNKYTGKVTNVWTFHVIGAYGIEFSASGRYLYITQRASTVLFQFDTWAKLKSDFVASKKFFFNSNWKLGALQIGPDKKIYISSEGSYYLDVINAPDSLGFACRISYNTIYLSGKRCTQGLPGFIQSFFGPNIISKNNCFLDTSRFSLSNTIQIDSVHWVFDDPLSGLMNRASGLNVFHLFSDTGSYTVQSVLYKGSMADTMYLDILQKNTQFNLGNDTFYCEKSKIEIGDFKGTFNKYEWNDKSVDSILTVGSPGTYSLKIQDKYGCYRYDTLIVSELKLPKLKLGNDTMICDTLTSIKLDAKNYLLKAKYRWNTGDTIMIFTAQKPGRYFVNVTNICGSAVDTLLVTYLPKPTINLSKDTIVCNKSAFLLDANVHNKLIKYLWNSGDSIAAILVKKSGKYSVTLSNFCGLAKDSIIVKLYQTPKPDISPDQVFCDLMISSTRTVKLNNSDESILWSTGTTDTSETFTAPGKYWVVINSPCQPKADTVKFIISNSPKIDLGNDTLLCGKFQFLLNAGNSGMQYLWSTGELTQTIVVTMPGQYNVTVINPEGCVSIGKLKIDNDCISNIWFPNSFTPDADQVNEIFKPVLLNVENYEMRIFNRWSELLFETYEIEKGWDGTYKGEICQSGVYFFLSNFISTENNTKQLVKGTITLIK